MLHALKRTLALLLLCLLALTVSATAENEAPGLDALLVEIPQSAYDGWLTYADLDALLALYGVEKPGDTEAFLALSGTPEEKAVMAAFMAVSAGPSDFFQNMFRARETLDATGLDFFHVQAALEIGMPPSQQNWLSGTFPGEPVRGKLADKGYRQVNTGIAGRETWALGGDLASGSQMNLQNRDPSFLFGGNLGQMWPVAQMPGILVSTRDEAGIRAIGFREGPFLGEDAAVEGILSALRGAGSLAQLYLLTPGKAELDVGGEGALPRWSLLALAHVFTPDAQRVVIALSYEDKGDAQSTADALALRLSADIPVSSGQTLQALVAGRGGEWEPVQTVAGLGGDHVALLPFRFPLPAPQSDDKDALPFRLFVNLLLRRDLGWLGTAGE